MYFSKITYSSTTSLSKMNMTDETQLNILKSKKENHYSFYCSLISTDVCSNNLSVIIKI
jgi:hypothetical protein